MAAGSSGDRSFVFDVDSGRPRHQLHHADYGMAALAFSPDSDRLAGATGLGGIHVWELATGRLAHHRRSGFTYRIVLR